MDQNNKTSNSDFSTVNYNKIWLVLLPTDLFIGFFFCGDKLRAQY